MVKKIEWKPEMLDENTYRVKVIGGWMLVTNLHSSKGGGVGICSLFISDQHYEWQILEPIIDHKIAKENLAKNFESAKK